MTRKTVKTLWIREQYLREILAGNKTIEVRVGYSNIRRLRPGDELLLNEKYRYQIVRIAWYDTFDALLQTENPGQISPGFNQAQLKEAFVQIYPPEKESLGVAALEIVKVQAGS